MFSLVGIGDVIAEKFRVDRVLGMGGMGMVVAATHLELREQVAIKLLLPDMAKREDIVARFLREARAIAKIRSEHVVRVFDVGTRQGSPFMVMELLQGASLSDVLRTGGPLAPGIAADYVVQACDAIGEAHDLGIVHRDIKPANLFISITRDGAPLLKVVDFGVSKLVDGATEMTNTSSLLGSPSYMSPEQILSAKDVDYRTDLWSLGVVLYELLSGERPFKGGSIPALCMSVMNDSPVPLRAKAPGVPAALEAIVARLLEKDPAKRHDGAEALVEELLPFVDRGAGADLAVIREFAGTAPSSGDAATMLDPLATSLLGVSSNASRRGRPRSRWLIGGALGAALVVAGIIGARLRPLSPEPARAADAPVPSAFVSPLPAAASSPSPSAESAPENAPGPSASAPQDEPTAKPTRVPVRTPAPRRTETNRKQRPPESAAPDRAPSPPARAADPFNDRIRYK